LVKDNFKIFLIVFMFMFCPGLFSQNYENKADVIGKKISDDSLLNTVQKLAFDFFWNEANPNNGLIKDRSSQSSGCSIASVGFGLTAICIGIDHAWISLEQGRNRVLTTLRTFWNGSQGTGTGYVMGYKGFFYHFLDMSTGYRTGSCELSSIDTGLLLAGILFCKQYFTSNDPSDVEIRQLADHIYKRVDFQWMLNGGTSLSMGWNPENGGSFLSARWRGYCEAMILNVLAVGSPTFPIDKTCWLRWTEGYNYAKYYGYIFVTFPPLFGHQYSHCWIDFRNINDATMGFVGFTYFENSKRATLANRAYCMENPKKFQGYGPYCWGLTACDGPNYGAYKGYNARGAPPAQEDDGTIAPTAAISSIPFTTQESMDAMRYMYDNYRPNIWTKYGFCDAFNLTANWFDKEVIGIDQGPIVIMIENYLNQKVWQKFMQNEDIQKGLYNIGFRQLTDIKKNDIIPENVQLNQNYPNPFNPGTIISYQIPSKSHVSLDVYDMLGRQIKNLVDEFQEAGSYNIHFDGSDLSGGIYFYTISVLKNSNDGSGRFRETKKFVLVK
jgi:hypothetical protein